MTKEERKQAICQITQGNTFVSTPGTGKRLLYRGKPEEFKVYNIPMELLVLNVENGRVASLVKSYEKEHGPLHPDNPNDAKILSQFLYEAHDKANDHTRHDLAKNGQLEPGIITSDGILVDGNRRFSLMWAILNDGKSSPDEKARCEFFRAVVLPEDADDKEILRLETSFQMGSDEKVGYNPIEKYLHARDMKERGFSIKEIAEYMGCSKTSDVDVYLEVMELIDDYLVWCDCEGIYTRLQRGVEDDLLKLNTACKKIDKGDISWIPEGSQEAVLNDLKCVCFDYIRLDMKSDDDFDFRAIASTANNNFLLNESIWNQFISEWKNATESVDEECIDDVLAKSHSSNDSKRLLDARDNKWRGVVKDKMKETFINAANVLGNKKEKDKPGMLIKKAANALKEVDVHTLSSITNLDEVKRYLADIKEILKDIETHLS